MDNQFMQPVDNSLRVLGELWPSERPSTRFDKMMDLIKTLAVNSIPGVIGQALETTGKVCSTLISGRQRIQAVKYVADAYEVKCRSEVELAKLNNERQKNQAITLYIEKTFQARMDELNRDIILRSKQMELAHSKSLYQIDAEHKQAILNMNLIAKEHLYSIDKRYAAIITRNENYCLLYRQYLKSLQDSNTTPGVLIRELSKRYMDMLCDFARNPSTNIEVMNRTVQAALELLDFLDKSGNYFVPFDKFVDQKKLMEDWSNGKL